MIGRAISGNQLPSDAEFAFEDRPHQRCVAPEVFGAGISASVEQLGDGRLLAVVSGENQCGVALFVLDIQVKFGIDEFIEHVLSALSGGLKKQLFQLRLG
ncbi:hypothetical protein AO263_18500, partial [Pseudomonas sp. NZIPFR-PS5]